MLDERAAHGGEPVGVGFGMRDFRLGSSGVMATFFSAGLSTCMRDLLFDLALDLLLASLTAPIRS